MVGIAAAAAVVIYAKIYYNSSTISYVGIIVLSFSYGLYLLMSIIRMNSGKRKNITLEDYVIAAMMIYFDWISVFK
jgi:FtsH-binding integral membrane protein